jgi:hypothetical protein
MPDTVEQGPVSPSGALLPSRAIRWVAAVLGFLVPGIGHQYAGLLRRAFLPQCLFPAADAVPHRQANGVDAGRPLEHDAAQQADAADEAGASDGAS